MKWKENNLHKIVTYSHTPEFVSWTPNLPHHTLINYLCLLLHWPHALYSSHPSLLSDFLSSFYLLRVSSFYSALFLQHPSRHLLGTPYTAFPAHSIHSKRNWTLKWRLSLLSIFQTPLPPCLHHISWDVLLLSFSPAPQVAFVQSFKNSFLLDSTVILLVKTFPRSKTAYKEKGKKDPSVPVR